MKIRNQTKYNSRTLRSIACAVYTDVRKTEGACWQWGALRIETVTARSGYSGWAHLNGFKMRLRLPPDKLDVAQFAALVEHELYHIYGVAHHKGSMNCWKHYKPELYQYAVDKIGATHLTPEAPKPKAKTDATAIRYERLLQREQSWLTKAKRAKNALAKIQKSKKYYEKKRAALKGKGQACTK